MSVLVLENIFELHPGRYTYTERNTPRPTLEGSIGDEDASRT